MSEGWVALASLHGDREEEKFLLQSVGSQRNQHDLATDQKQQLFISVLLTGGLIIVNIHSYEQSSTLAWKIPWMEEPGRLQSIGSQRFRHE